MRCLRLRRRREAESKRLREVDGLPVAKARPRSNNCFDRARPPREGRRPTRWRSANVIAAKRSWSLLLSDQWFVKIKPLAEPAIQAVEDGRVRIIPEAWKNNYLGWMRDIKDWCVSRQIWWGHQIPAWYCETCYGPDFCAAASDGAPLIPSDAIPIVALTKPATLCPTAAQRIPCAGSRRPGHLVLLRILALFNIGMAAADAGIENVLSHLDPRDRTGHSVFLGGPHDHDGPEVHGTRCRSATCTSTRSCAMPKARR